MINDYTKSLIQHAYDTFATNRKYHKVHKNITEITLLFVTLGGNTCTAQRFI